MLLLIACSDYALEGEGRYQAAWEAGRSLSAEEAMAEALSEPVSTPAAR